MHEIQQAGDENWKDSGDENKKKTRCGKEMISGDLKHNVYIITKLETSSRKKEQILNIT